MVMKLSQSPPLRLRKKATLFIRFNAAGPLAETSLLFLIRDARARARFSRDFERRSTVTFCLSPSAGRFAANAFEFPCHGIRKPRIKRAAVRALSAALEPPTLMTRDSGP